MNRYAEAKLQVDKYYKLIKFTSSDGDEDILLPPREVYGPERRVFKIDTEMMPKRSVNEHMKSMVERCRKILDYHSETGEIFRD